MWEIVDKDGMIISGMFDTLEDAQDAFEEDGLDFDCYEIVEVGGDL